MKDEWAEMDIDDVVFYETFSIILLGNRRPSPATATHYVRLRSNFESFAGDRRWTTLDAFAFLSTHDNCRSSVTVYLLWLFESCFFLQFHPSRVR